MDERKVWVMASHGELWVYHCLENSKAVSPVSKPLWGMSKGPMGFCGPLKFRE